MESIPHKPLRAAYHCSLTLLSLTCMLGTADARRMLLPSEQFPGPWLEVTQEIRDVLTLNKVSACSQAAAREFSRTPGEYLLYCTSDEKLGQAGAYNPRRAPFEARAGSSKVSHRRTDIKSNRAVAMSSRLHLLDAMPDNKVIL